MCMHKSVRTYILINNAGMHNTHPYTRTYHTHTHTHTHACTPHARTYVPHTYVSTCLPLCLPTYLPSQHIPTHAPYQLRLPHSLCLSYLAYSVLSRHRPEITDIGLLWCLPCQLYSPKQNAFVNSVDRDQTGPSRNTWYNVDVMVALPTLQSKTECLCKQCGSGSDGPVAKYLI